MTAPDSKTPDPFVIDPKPVPWPVDVRVAVAGGGFETRRFTALMRVLSEEEHNRLAPAEQIKNVDAAEAAEQLPPARTNEAILAENARLFPDYVAGWEGIKDAAGNPVAFSVEALQALVKGPYGMAASAGLWVAVAEVRNGVRLGNCAAPPVTG